MSLWIKIIVVVACMALGLAFHLRNDRMVTLDYLLGSKEFYLSIWLLAALVIGVILGFLGSLPVILRLKRHNFRLSRQTRLSETEINNLRPVPEKDS